MQQIYMKLNKSQYLSAKEIQNKYHVSSATLRRWDSKMINKNSQRICWPWWMFLLQKIMGGGQVRIERDAKERRKIKKKQRRAKFVNKIYTTRWKSTILRCVVGDVECCIGNWVVECSNVQAATWRSGGILMEQGIFSWWMWRSVLEE